MTAVTTSSSGTSGPTESMPALIARVQRELHAIPAYDFGGGMLPEHGTAEYVEYMRAAAARARHNAGVDGRKAALWTELADGLSAALRRRRGMSADRTLLLHAARDAAEGFRGHARRSSEAAEFWDQQVARDEAKLAGESR